MSQNSAAKPGFFSQAANVVGQSAWVLLGLFGIATFAVGIIFGTLPHDIVEYLGRTTPGLLLAIAILYIVALAVIVGIPVGIRYWFTRKRPDIRKLLGIDTPLKFKALAWVPLAWLGYFVATVVVTMIALNFPGFNADQSQDVPFRNLNSANDLLIAFMGLVVFAPVAEEMLFRGYLFGKLRAVSNFWVSTIATSLVFGIAHQQWNVGIDVFVLSIFLCLLREKTGNIWAGMLLHGLKNSIAFFYLFIAPLVGLQ